MMSFCHLIPSTKITTRWSPSISNEPPLTPDPISPDLYVTLINFSKLIDISYCISPLTSIQYPFHCDGDCSEFPHTELVHQWESSDFTRPIDIIRDGDIFGTSGYIAVCHDLNIIVVSLRGTRSFKDSIIDLNADMIPYGEDESLNMKVHRGFYFSYLHTWEEIRWHLAFQTAKYPNYKLAILGHSMGGAIANLLTLRAVQEEVRPSGYLIGVSMGQPMVGNFEFTEFLNKELDLQTNGSLSNNAKFIRVTHKNDPVVHLPWLTESPKTPRFKHFFPSKANSYFHSNNEVYINEIGPEVPLQKNVYHCIGREDIRCSYGSRSGNPKDNTEHLNYFKRLGICGFSFGSL